MSSKTVEHIGFVQEINENVIKVSILSQSACAACHAKGACSSSDMQDKIIEVKSFNNSFSLGEKVNVILQESLGVKAMILGYLFPLIVVLISIVITTNLTSSEGIAGLISISTLIPYYFMIYLFKNKLSKTFSFAIKKL
ncbi:MAG TPA: Fis family transcriptional regulator [Bacteroidales bacterium]|nr:MAG: hypothetical protein A2W98_14275 [Bacteroidetes bacterium GWF2_33_38]HBF88537.1 Fis family transcriptional regulator [Bacteroidales bacterium]